MRFQGTLEIRGATLVDAPPEEPKNTHASFLITGDPAQALYEAIRGEPFRDECLDDGSVRKSAGNLVCVRLANDHGYECDFAIELEARKIEPGRVC
jgi:hypothetical protein